MTEMHDSKRVYADMEQPTAAELKEVREVTLAWADALDKRKPRPNVRIVFLTCVNIIMSMGPAYCRIAAATLKAHANKREMS